MAVKRRIGVSSLLIIASSLSLHGPASAQDSEARIRELEKRLQLLEKRLAAAEAKEQGDRRAAAPARNGSKRTATASTSTPAVTPADVTVASPDAKPDNPEFSIVRENVATLAARSYELSAGVGYTKNNSLLQSDRAFNGYVSGRFGIFDGVELGINMPYYYSYRYTQTGPSESVANRAASLGDTAVQATALVLKESASLPAVNVSVGANLPTGARPYTFGSNFQAGQNPIDPLFGRQSRGEWAGFANLQFVKTYDPVVLFAGFGAEQSVDSTVQGYKLSWPTRFTYNAGFSFIVSNTSTIGFALIGSYQGDLRVDGARARNSQSEPVVGRLSLSQRLAPDFYMEPSVGIGLSKDAPSLNASLAVRKRF